MSDEEGKKVVSNKSQTDAEEQASKDQLDAVWSELAVPSRKELSLDTQQIDNLIATLFRIHSAIFRLSTTISQINVGDIDAAKKSNADAVEIASKSLDSLKELYDSIKLSYQKANDLEHK